MKLSMWIINSELSKKYDTIPLITVGERDIESVRLFSSHGAIENSSRYVFIGKTDDFFMSHNPGSVILTSGFDIVFVKHNNSDVIEVLNDIIIVFDKYRKFDEQIKFASNTNTPFQDMLDIMHGIFQTPMLFGQKDLRIFALTKQYSDVDVYDGWDEVKKFYTMPITLINTTVAPDMQKYPDSIKTVAIPVSENEHKHFYYQIRSNVYCNNKLWGHFYIYYNKKSVPMSVLQMARYCADAYGDLLNRIALEDSSSKYKKYTYLMDILDGKNVAPEIIENLKWQMGWKLDDKLCLYKISLLEELYSDVFFDFAIRNIDSYAKDEIVFPYDKNIIIITKQSDKNLDDIAHIKLIMTDGDYVCGVSYPFNKLSMIAYAYFQAGFAIDFNKAHYAEQNYFYYSDCGFPGLITYVREKLEYKAFIPPALLEIYKMDKQTGTDYYRTLFWYLATNCHAASTAKKLYIHRNTLKYRLDRIYQIINIDLADNDNVAYLRLCYSLMIGDYPIEPEEIGAREICTTDCPEIMLTEEQEDTSSDI